MAQYFKLYKIGKIEAERFVDVDADICQALNLDCDSDKWAANWYNIIGLMLACGKDWEWIKDEVKEDKLLLNITQWLSENYTTDCWSGR